MTREEITNSQDYKAQGIALDWWRRNGYDIRDGVVDIIDAYQEGVIYGWNNPNWISVEDELPKKLEGVGVSTYVLVKYGLSEDKEYNVMRYNYRVNRWFDKSYKSHKNITHWMPIVPPRKEE